jgi:hypothetical protein
MESQPDQPEGRTTDGKHFVRAIYTSSATVAIEVVISELPACDRQMEERNGQGNHRDDQSPNPPSRLPCSSAHAAIIAGRPGRALTSGERLHHGPVSSLLGGSM